MTIDKGVPACDVRRRRHAKWVAQWSGDVSTTPAVVGGQLYVPDWAGMLTRIDAATGSVVWSKYVGDLAELPSPEGGIGDGAAFDAVIARATPIVASGNVIFGLVRRGFNVPESLAYMVAVDHETGALRWKTLVDPHVAAVLTAPPALEGGRIYVGVSSQEERLSLNAGYSCTFRGSVVAIDAATGAWRRSLRSISTPTPSNGRAA